jgi:acyl-CoA dehydrogenase
VDRVIFEEEHRLFRESVRAFIDRVVRPNHEEWRSNCLIGREFWLEAGRDGLLGLAMPQEHGGSGLGDFRFNAIVTEELAGVALAFASAYGIHADVVAPYLLELTTDEQKERWVPGFCSGELVTALGMTEPGAGSDLAGIGTRATRDGAGWVLNGSKTFITNGTSSDLVLIAARTGPGRRDLTIFAVERDMPGFVRGRKLEKLGQPEADTAELFLHDVRVDETCVIGAVDGAFAAMMERLAQERLHAACENLGHATAQLARTLEYVKQRTAFGRPIGTFQNSRFLLAELVTKLDVAQTYVDACIMAHVQRRLTPVDAAKAKWWSAEVQNEIVDGCVQLHGGYGYMTEYEVARAWADARVTKIWAGTNEIMKEIIGRDLGLAEPRS